MKYTSIRIAGLLFAATTALGSCTQEEFVSMGGKNPDEEGLRGTTSVLCRTERPDNRFIVSGQEADDILRVRLSKAAETSLKMTATPDDTKVAAYNKEHATDFEPFPVEYVTLEYEKSIPAGAKESADLTVKIRRADAQKGRYLLPVTVQIEGLGDQPRTMTYYYVVLILEPAQEGELDTWDFKVVAYINTEEMQPIIATKYSIDYINQFTGDEVLGKTWVDIVCIRPAKIVRRNGSAVLELGQDMQYVLDNREQYIVPVQKLGRKVLFCVNGGFRNLSDIEIADLTFRIKYTTEKYKLDGVNFLEMDAVYADDAPAIDPESYTKLIKATKEALGKDKLVTVACDPQTTDDLAATYTGIQAGPYIDYAWTGIIDQFVDPYNGSEAVLKPIAGLEQSKWGSLTLKTHDTAWQVNKRDAFVAEVSPLCWGNPESCNVFAFWDLPPSRSGIERGAGEAFEILVTYILSDLECIYDGRFYVVSMSQDAGGSYGKFSKDW